MGLGFVYKLRSDIGYNYWLQYVWSWVGMALKM